MKAYPHLIGGPDHPRNQSDAFGYLWKLTEPLRAQKPPQDGRTVSDDLRMVALLLKALQGNSAAYGVLMDSVYGPQHQRQDFEEVQPRKQSGRPEHPHRGAVVTLPSKRLASAA